MAIFHLHIKHIGKGNNRSAVAASAYCSGSKLIEERFDPATGCKFEVTHNYSNKKGVVFSRIFTPSEASLWMQDREALWNLIQNRFDTRKNAVYAQEIDIALPVELILEDNKALICEFVQEVLVREGIIADVNIHLDDVNNPHAHIMLSTREIIKGEGEEYIFGKKVRYWDTKEFLLHIRRMWSLYLNRYLAMRGIEEEVSHLSYLERGIAMIPGVKEGLRNTVIGSERAKKNSKITEENIKRIHHCPELVIDRLRRNKSAFTREEVVRELGKFYKTDSTEFVKVLEEVMSSRKLVLLNARNIDGKLLYVDEQRFALEQDFLSVVKRLAAKDRSSMHSLEVEFHDLETSDISDRQKEVVIGILNGGNISVVEGLPGSGKTSVMKEVVHHYIQYGYDVIGTAVSSSAAAELGSVINVKSYNTTKLRYEMNKASGNKWELSLPIDYWQKLGLSPKANIFTALYKRLLPSPLLHEKSVLIIDEATMIDLAEMHFFLSNIEKTGAKLILIGDSGQLSSVGIKGAFEKVEEVVPALCLNETKRQIYEQDRMATRYLSEYKIADSIEIYKNSGNFIFKDNIEETASELVKDFVEKYLKKENKDIMALAYTNNRIFQLNYHIREKLKEYGEIYGSEVSFSVIRNGDISDIFFACGDRVVFNKNDRYIGVFNGDLGQIVGFGKSRDGARDTIIVELARDKNFLGMNMCFKVEVDNLHYKNLDYGFAVNIYKAQGRTYDEVYALIDNYIGYHSFNVMATRHRELLKMYVGDDILKDVLYQKIDLDVDNAREKWNIKSSKEDMRYAALISIVTKRDNRSFGEDYKNLSKSKNADFVSEYIEVRNYAIKLMELIYREGKSNNDELKSCLARRTKIANEICNNYDRYGVILSQAGIRYDTLEKHAGRNKYKYFFEDKNTENNIANIDGMAQLVEQFLELQKCEIGDLFDRYGMGFNHAKALMIGIHNITRKIIIDFEELKLDIYKIRMDLEQVALDKKKAQNFIIEAKEFIDVTIPYFLSTIYKDPPEDVLTKWDYIVRDNQDIENALTKVRHDPQILGNLKGVGLGRVFAFSKKRSVAQANSYIMVERLKLYEEYKRKIPSLREKISNEKYDKTILELSYDIKLLESKLPWSQLEGFIKELYMRSNIYTTKKEVEMVDSMISWAKKQTILSSIYQIPKARYDSRKYTGLTFDDVSNSISSSNIEGIFRDYIHLINPDSDIERKARSIKAGSLEMNLENGLWHRFSTNQGGNIFGFVREATGVSKRESLEIVASYGYIGRQIPKTSIVSSRDSYNLLKKPKDLWAVYKPLPINAPEFEPNKHISFLLKENNLDSIHSYRDKNGYIIGHTIRLINKENSSKQVMPISYCHNSFLKKSEWRLKAFADDNGNKPIYGMEKLYRDKVTLIVEGEKTADKAEILLPDYNVISWLGGAGNADKVDWSILKDREVVIWPDNDLAGFIAAKTIINRLNSITHSIDKVSIVDIESLNLPQKWDLADEMPSGITIDMIKESIVNSMQNANSLTYIRILADNSSDEVEKRIIWQNRNSGFVLSTKEIEKELFEENRLYNKICSKDAIFYVKYANNKGISSSAHEFLDIEHDLYRESLIAIAKYHGSKINLEQNIPDFLDELQIIYMQKKDNFTGHLDYIKNGSELYNILLRDILLLHQMQMSSNVNVKLSDLHKEMVVQNISKIIYDYSSSSDKLEDQDRIKIADAVYNKCCDSNWWKDLIEARFEIRNQPQDFDIQKFCKHHIENNISRKNNVFHVQQNNIKFIEEKNTLDHNIARVEKTVQLYKAKSLTKDM